MKVEQELKGRNARQLAARFDLLQSRWQAAKKRSAELGGGGPSADEIFHQRTRTNYKNELISLEQVERDLDEELKKYDGTQEAKLSAFLRESREKLKLELESVSPPKPRKMHVPKKKRAKIKTDEEEQLDDEITQMFQFYNMHMPAPKKSFGNAAVF